MSNKILSKTSDFSLLALSEGLQFGHSRATMYRNKKTDEFVITVDDMEIGPMKLNQLEALVHVSRDTLDLLK